MSKCLRFFFIIYREKIAKEEALMEKKPETTEEEGKNRYSVQVLEIC